MQALKAIVIGMAMLIVIGFGILVGTMIHTANSPSPTPKPVVVPVIPLQPTALSSPAVPYDLTVPAPAGMSLKDVSQTGGEILFHFSGAAGDQVVAVDPVSGHVAGTVSVPTPSAPSPAAPSPSAPVSPP